MDQTIENLFERRARIEAAGGPKRIEKQRASGKMTARERIHELLDADTFVELDAFARHRCSDFGMGEVDAPGEGVVTGYGLLAGRLVYCFAQDFTVIGGSLGEAHSRKICKVLDLAVKMGAPVIGINDSGGARIQEAVDSLSGYGNIFYRNSRASGVIPQISAIMGPCAGGATYSPALTDFIFMVEKTSNMFITGPAVIKAVTGEDVDTEVLGGAMTHNQTSGVAHFACRDEIECFERIRELMSYLPSNNLDVMPVGPTNDDPCRRCENLNEIMPDSPNRAYDIFDVIRSVVDDAVFLEVQPHYARNIVTCFARLAGHSVGILANQPQVMSGCLDINASDKACRFITFCDSFNIPLVNFVDVPGFLPGTAQEYGGIIRHGAKMLYAYSNASVPKVTVVLRKAYGGAYIAMCAKELGADMVLAWPMAEIAVMGPEGAANIIFRREIEEATDPAAVRAEKIEQYRREFSNPYQAAARGFVDDVIEPAVTRMRVASSLAMLYDKREGTPRRKHGIFPV
jgi:acetyl-CoA carboxylase carboxyltransferase component